jgi:cell shape-determining protein MreC
MKIAKVQLMQDENFLIPIYSGETKISGILNNNRQFSSCEIEFSPLNKKAILNEGEVILTSPEDGLIPADIKIGYISKKNNQYCVVSQFNILKDKLFGVKNIFSLHKWD